MDDLVKRSIREVEANQRQSVPWKLDEPWNQNYQIFSSEQGQWSSVDPTSTPPSSIHPSISRLALLSWNIDFMLPFPDSRMRAAVRHLQHSHIDQQDERTASVVFLQECLYSDLQLLAADPWIRKTFAMTDVDIENWQSGYYGTVTLVDRRLPISSCFRVHYSQTRMERDVLILDVRFGTEGRWIRLCNSHLESLAFEPPYRPPQMRMIAKYMHDGTAQGAIAAGDFNAIQDFDRNLHTDNGVKDAYLELGGDERDAESGHTWGQQAATVMRDRFGTCRMDKVYFCGAVKCVEFFRFGGGVEVEDENERLQIVQLGFNQPWITDHLGVKGVFELASEGSKREGHL